MADNGGQFSEDSIGQKIADAQMQDQHQGSGEAKVDEQSQVASIISDLDRRLRVLEERYGNLRKKVQLTDQNLIDSERSFGREIRNSNEEILELKRSISDFNDKVILFGSEMNTVAKKTDLRIVEKYLAMWDPNMFVTRKQLKEYLNSKGTARNLQEHPEEDPDDSTR